jgi:hypothetical protein
VSSDREALRLADIIDAAAAYIGDMDQAAFVADQKTVDAVERCLQRTPSRQSHPLRAISLGYCTCRRNRCHRFPAY